MNSDSSYLAGGTQEGVSGSGVPAHTPGPWSRGSSELAGTWITARFPEDTTGSVCRVYSHMYMGPDESEANLRLILSAPDFLKGAQHLIAYEEAMDADDHISAMSHYADAVDTLRAAVLKATGAPHAE